MKSDAPLLFFGLEDIRYSNILYSVKKWLFAIPVIAVCLVGSSAWADSVPKEDLVIHANGFIHDRGKAIASLFHAGDDIFGKPHSRVMATIHQGKATLVFSNVKPDSYAVIVFHDENDNNNLDHNFLRLPAEPLGYSNGFKLTLFSGLPSFEKLRFAFAAGVDPVEIQVK